MTEYDGYFIIVQQGWQARSRIIKESLEKLFQGTCRAVQFESGCVSKMQLKS